MLFIIVSAVAVTLGPIVWVIWFSDYDDFPSRFVAWLYGGVFAWVGVVALGMILSLVTVAVGTTNQTRTADLRALGSNSAIEGRSYFLGGGYVNEKRVLNYIEQHDDGGLSLQQADAEDSIIFEDSDRATVIIDYKHSELLWLLPAVFDWDLHYTFHIPEGSVLENYTITN